MNMIIKVIFVSRETKKRDKSETNRLNLSLYNIYILLYITNK